MRYLSALQPVSGSLTFQSIVVCGLNSCLKKVRTHAALSARLAYRRCSLTPTLPRQGFEFYVRAEDPDILVLTETKADKEVENELLKSKYPVRWQLLKATLTRSSAFTDERSLAPRTAPHLGLRSKERLCRNCRLFEGQATESRHWSPDTRS